MTDQLDELTGIVEYSYRRRYYEYYYISKDADRRSERNEKKDRAISRQFHDPQPISHRQEIKRKV